MADPGSSTRRRHRRTHRPPTGPHHPSPVMPQSTPVMPTYSTAGLAPGTRHTAGSRRATSRRPLEAKHAAPPSNSRVGSTGRTFATSPRPTTVPEAHTPLMYDEDQVEEWIDDMRHAAVESTEWKMAAKRIFERLQVHLTDNHMLNFSEMNPTEKMTWINQVEKDIVNDPAYINLSQAVSRIVDRTLNDIVAADVGPYTAVEGKVTKTDCLLDRSSQAATSLLTKWPDQRHQLRVLANQRLRQPLQREVWRLHLVDPKARKEFEQRLKDNRVETISSADAEIAHKCQELLASEFGDVLQRVGKTATAMSTAMKTLLSYQHVKQDKLPEAFYYLAIPLVVVLKDDCEDIPRLIEAHRAMMQKSRPRYIINSKRSIEKQASAQFAAQFGTLLRAHDAELYNVVSAVLVEEGGAGVSPNEVLAKLVEPCVERVFVGVCNLDTVLYMWDHCLIAGFDSVYYFCVIFLVLLREGLLVCRTSAALRRVFEMQGPVLHFSQFRKEMELRFMKKVRSKLALAIGGTIPYEEVLRLAFEPLATYTPQRPVARNYPELSRLQPAALPMAVPPAEPIPPLVPSQIGLVSAVPPPTAAAHDGPEVEETPSARSSYLGRPVSQLMTLWATVAHHAALWVLFLQEESRTLAARKDHPASAPRPAARVGGVHASTDAHAPVTSWPLRLSGRESVSAPHVYLYADRITDVLDRVGLGEDDDAEVTALVYQRLPFVEDDSDDIILMLNIGENVTLPLRAIAKGDPSRGREAAEVAVRREGLSRSLVPKLQRTLQKFTQGLEETKEPLGSRRMTRSLTVDRSKDKGSSSSPLAQSKDSAVGREHADQQLRKFFKRIVVTAMTGVSLIALGDEAEKAKMISQADANRARYVKARNALEVQVFGKPLKASERADMSPKQKKKYEKKVSRVLLAQERSWLAKEAREMLARRGPVGP